jgi:hypothetical protein
MMNARIVCRAVFAITMGTYLWGCNNTSSGSGTGGTGGAHQVSDAAVGDGTCTTDSLRTGLIIQQTGVEADAYDCEILEYATQFNEPDPMIFKAIIYVESRFDYTAVGCPNACPPCPSGWSADECGCCGLMQSLAPSCSYDKDRITFLPNGHPDMETDPTASDWAGSVFNPDVNIKARGARRRNTRCCQSASSTTTAVPKAALCTTRTTGTRSLRPIIGTLPQQGMPSSTIRE